RDVNEAIQNAGDLIEKSFQQAIYQDRSSDDSGAEEAVEDSADSGDESKGKNVVQTIYSHLMTGVSYMIPFVVAGGILTALSFAFGGIDAEGEFASTLSELGDTAMTLMWPALGGYVAFSIASRPGLIPGMVIGLLSANIEAG